MEWGHSACPRERAGVKTRWAVCASVHYCSWISSRLGMLLIMQTKQKPQVAQHEGKAPRVPLLAQVKKGSPEHA